MVFALYFKELQVWDGSIGVAAGLFEKITAVLVHQGLMKEQDGFKPVRVWHPLMLYPQLEGVIWWLQLLLIHFFPLPVIPTKSPKTLKQFVFHMQTVRQTIDSLTLKWRLVRWYFNMANYALRTNDILKLESWPFVKCLKGFYVVNWNLRPLNFIAAKLI